MKNIYTKIICALITVAISASLAACAGKDAVPVSTPPPPAETSDSNPLQLNEPEPSSQQSEQELSSSSAQESELERSSSSSQSEESSTSSSTSSQAPALTEKSSIPEYKNVFTTYALNPTGACYVGGRSDLENSHQSDFIVATKNGLALFAGLDPVSAKAEIENTAFLLWSNDGVRHVYGITLDGNFVADGKTYALTKERAQEIMDFHAIFSAHLNAETEAYPRWLIWMTPSKIQSVIYHSPTNGALTIAPEVANFAVGEAYIYGVNPVYDSTFGIGEIDFSGKDVFHLEIKFNNGESYNIYSKGKDYYVQSSEMNYGCKYRFYDNSNASGATLMERFEYIATAKTMQDVTNPVT